MGVVLNELCCPKSDPRVEEFLYEVGFCSTYALRPVGALIFGNLGDTIGRKSTIILTTFIIAISCIVMANLPTYDQIGMKTVWIMTICRMLQGMSSMEGRIGASIYITEITKPPMQYMAVTLLGFLAALGGTFALAVGTLVTSKGFNWRMAFWLGAGVALVGVIARTALREMQEFANAKLRLKEILSKTNAADLLKGNVILQDGVNMLTVIANFITLCYGPICVYFSYIHCGNILKHKFFYTA